jgi:protein-tyrosine phosphatase
LQGWKPNLDWITPRLAVGGSFPCDRAGDLVRDFGFGAVVDLRREACDDERALAAHGIDFLHLPTPDMAGVSLAMLEKGVAFTRDHLEGGRRVLIHCQHGIGRSALLALCVLVETGHAPLEALELAKSQRACVSPSPEQFAAWLDWLELHSYTREVEWELPSFEGFAEIAYRHLRTPQS